MIIKELDDFLKEFLINELVTLGFDQGSVKIAFNQPKREWSAQISQPTLNLFLYDIRENQKLRQMQPGRVIGPNLKSGELEQRRQVIRIDLHYLITAWGMATEDEHALISSTMIALLRNPSLPDNEKCPLPNGLKDSGKPILLSVAQYEEMPNPTEIWNVLGNEIRPAMVSIITITIDPYLPIPVKFVHNREIRIGELEKLDATSDAQLETKQPIIKNIESSWTIGGRLHSSQNVNFKKIDALLTFVQDEHGMPILQKDRRLIPVKIQEDGQFVISTLKAGEYLLDLKLVFGANLRFRVREAPNIGKIRTFPTRDGSVSSPTSSFALRTKVRNAFFRQFPIRVPSPDYELEI
jgi:hypothetical protein